MREIFFRFQKQTNINTDRKTNRKTDRNTSRETNRLNKLLIARPTERTLNKQREIEKY